MTTMQSARLNAFGLAARDNGLRSPARELDVRPASSRGDVARNTTRRPAGYIATRRTTRLLPADLW